MSDISITVTADPSQAVAGLEEVRNAAAALAESAKKVQASTDAAGTDAINSVSTVSRDVLSTIAQTSDALGGVSGSIKAATREAGTVAGALGKSIPVISQIGSAIATAITGPVGAISAVVGLAIAGIRKMIQEVQSEVELMQRKAAGKASSAYDALMQGRKDYADQLAVLAQVREINRYAEQNKLTTEQLAQFRQLASQIGIAERDVGDRGIRTGKLGEAARSLRQQRDHYAEREYETYLSAMQVQLNEAIASSGLSDEFRKRLAPMSALSRAEYITKMAQSSAGMTLGDYRAWQDLYAVVKPLNEVRASYNRDKMLGRDQSVLNSVIADDFQKAAEKKAKEGSAASGSSGPAEAGTLAYANEQDKLAQAELDAEEERKKRVDRLIAGMDRQIQMNELIAEGKEKEAFLLKNRLQAEDLNGKALTEAQTAEIDARSERLWALQHPEDPALAPEDPGSPVAASRTRARAQQEYAPKLDRLQQIGANLRSPAVSPEKLVMDKQLTTQERIYSLLQSNFSASRQIGGAITFP